MRFILINFFLLLLFIFSNPKTGYSYFYFNSKKIEDSTIITVPFNLKFNTVPEEYIIEKRAKIDSFYNKFINSPFYSGSFIVVKNGKVIYEDYKGFANVKTGKKLLI